MTNDVQAFAEIVDRFVGYGWNERVSFMVVIEVNGEKVQERRTETRRQQPLLTQLEQAVYHVPVRGGGGGASANKPESKIPGNLVRSYDLMHEVRDFAQGYVEMWRLSHNGVHPLRTLVESASQQEVSEIRDVVRGLRTMERKIRLFLGYDAQKRLLADTSCDKCGGALIVAEDASSDVRCIGTPSERSCGHVYPRWQWISLYEAQQRESQ